MDIRDLYQYYMTIAAGDDADLDTFGPQFVNLSTFEFDVPSFPRPKSSNLAPVGDQTIATRFSRIDQSEQQTAALLTKQKQAELEAFKPPPFLPPFPPQHTFSFTPILHDRTKDAYTLQQLKTKQRRQVESSLTRIHNSELMDKIPEGMLLEEEWEFFHEQQQAQQANMSVVDHNAPDQIIKSKDSNIDEELVVNPYLIVMRQKSSTNTPRPVQQQPIVPSAEIQPQQENGEASNAEQQDLRPTFTTLSLKRPFISRKDDFESKLVKGDEEVITGVAGQDLEDVPLVGKDSPSGEPNRKKQKKTHPNGGEQQ